MSNPANTPLAFMTVMYRPFPIEAGNVVGLASSMEGVFLMVLTFQSRKRLRWIFRGMRRRPYVAYCVGIMWTFVFAFSSFSNFGILARQRCQVLPFFLALLCLPQWSREGTLSVEEAVAARDTAPPELDPDAPLPSGPYDDTPLVDQREVRAADRDPYADADFDWDPYRRFHDRPNVPHRDDG